jgi:MFS family permease
VSRSALLRDRQIRALLAAEVISTTGAQMTWVALPWFVLLTTGSATKTTFVVAAEVIGLALLGLPGGRVLGRLGARRTMLLCDGARAPLMVVIPILHWTGGLTFPILLAVAFALGSFAAPYFAARTRSRSPRRRRSSRPPLARRCSPDLRWRGS